MYFVYCFRDLSTASRQTFAVPVTNGTGMDWNEAERMIRSACDQGSGFIVAQVNAHLDREAPSLPETSYPEALVAPWHSLPEGRAFRERLTVTDVTMGEEVDLADLVRAFQACAGAWDTRREIARRLAEAAMEHDAVQDLLDILRSHGFEGG